MLDDSDTMFGYDAMVNQCYDLFSKICDKTANRNENQNENQNTNENENENENDIADYLFPKNISNQNNFNNNNNNDDNDQSEAETAFALLGEQIKNTATNNPYSS